MKFHMFFKWHRDEAFDAMNDAVLNDKAKELVMNLKPENITCESVRNIHQKLADHNDLLAIEELKKFMKEDYEGLPRYVRYVQDILSYGVYPGNGVDPSKFVEFVNSVQITSEDYGLEVEFVIPEQFYIEDWGRGEYIKQILSSREALADGLWEGMPGSVAVHTSCAVVNYGAW
jgi:hypothetical protein